MQFWNARTGRPIAPLPEDDADVVAYSPDGSLLAAGRFDGRIDVWDARTGVLRESLKGRLPPKVGPLTYSPSDGTLAAGVRASSSPYSNGYVQLWNPHTALLDWTLAGYGYDIAALAIQHRDLLLHPDGPAPKPRTCNRTCGGWEQPLTRWGRWSVRAIFG